MFNRKSVVSLLSLMGVCALLPAQNDTAPSQNQQTVVETQAVPPQEQLQTQQPAQFKAEPLPQQHAGTIQWTTNYQEAVQKAKAEKKPLFLFFTGSDWCGWCKKMESEILSTPDFANAAGSRFVFVMLDFPMNQTLPPDVAQQNAQLKQKYGVTGYPTVIVLDQNENFVSETGYRSGGGKAYADYLFGLVH